MNINDDEDRKKEVSTLNNKEREDINILKEMNIHAILCCLVKSLNYVVYEYVLIKRVTEEVERMLITVNVNKVFT